MKFVCSKDLFAKTTKIVQRGTSTAQLPILAGILLQTDGAQLTLAATDTEEGIECKVPIQTEEEGGVVLDGHYLAEIVRKMPGPSISVEKNQEDRTVRISSQDSYFDLVYIEPEEFPQFPQVDIANTFSLPQKVLEQMINRAVVTLADQNAMMKQLQGALFEGRDDIFHLVGTDGRRLAINYLAAGEDVTLPDEDFSVILHGKILRDVATILGDDEKSQVEVCLGTNHVVFQLPGVKIIARKMEGEYPGYEEVIPKNFCTELTMSRSKLAAAVDRLSLLGVGKENIPLVRFRVEDGSLILNSKDQTKGQGEERFAVEKTGQNLELTFNGKFLLEGLAALSGEEVRIYLSGPMSASLFTSPDDPNFKYILMPTFD